ncbi:MAG: SET domain-containing methyltransferase [Candidatus Woesearchaeota archaeon]
MFAMDETLNGRAVFADCEISKGEEVLVLKGEFLQNKDIAPGSYEEEHSIQIGKDLYLGPSGELDDFINHSCSPNTGLKMIGGKLILVAIKKIRKGDEICFDYSTSMAEDRWEMNCSCGSKNCRKLIRDFKHLPKKVKQKYLKTGIVPEYIYSGGAYFF